MSRKHTLRAACHIWNSSNHTDRWDADLNDRVSVITWQFGSIHQCKILIKYNDDVVGICLEAQPTRLAAMRHGVAWAKNYIDNGLPSAKQVFDDCFKHYPTLFYTRVDVIEHVFFVVGGGYDWLDGSVVCNSPESHLRSKKNEAKQKRINKSMSVALICEEIYGEKFYESLPPKLKESIKKIVDIEFDKKKEVVERPLPDEGMRKNFYPVSDNYSLITNVPDDVKDEWLALAYEAAIMLRDRSNVIELSSESSIDNVRNIEIGTRVVRELTERFGARIEALNA
jgi:hypothetical protein